MTIFPQLRVVNNRDGGHYADVSGMAYNYCNLMQCKIAIGKCFDML